MATRHRLALTIGAISAKVTFCIMAQDYSENLVKAAVQFFKELTEDYINEIRGHLTAQILREWIGKYKSIPEVKKCFLYLELTPKKYLGAFLLSDDDSFLYGASGKPLAAVFLAKTMDKELTELFLSDNMVILKV